MFKDRYRLGYRAIMLLMVFALVAAACSSDDEAATTTAATATTVAESGDTTDGATIGFAISSFDNDFFVSLKDGVESAAAAAGATVTITDAGGDAATQASQVEDFITKGVDLIMVNPVDSDAIVPSVEAANAAGIPVIAVDRGSAGGDIVATVASDNVLGGTMAGEYLFELMGGAGEILELQGIIGTSAAQDRGEGFQIALDAEAGITRVAQQTANFARAEGLTVTENLLQANADATGLFAHNDDMALGAVEAAAAAGRDLFIVGFDAAPDAIQAIADGTMAGTIAQQPVLIGELAVEAAMKVLAGETVPTVVAVPVALVTPDNVNEFLGDDVAAPVEDVTIGFAISSFDNDFFVSLKDGVESAAAAAGATVTITDAGGDAATQASQVEDFITKGVDLIMVNPVDSDAIVPSVEAANAAGIPVIAVDRGSAGGDIVATVASDNVLGGTMAGEYLFELMGGAGEILELQGIIGTSAAQDRGEGFQIALDAEAGITRVAQQTANFARAEGLTVTENLLQANADATGLFAHNDDMALGAVEAAAAAGRDLFIVGFDAAPDAIQAIADGTMAGTIAQQPVLIGELAVEAAMKVLAGETVPTVVAVPVALVTPDNVNEFLN